MTEAPGAGETEGTRTRGSIARRMLVAAAIWSAVVLLVAGWSLQAFYRAETDQQLDLANSDTLRTLAAHCHGDARPDCPILTDLDAAGRSHERAG